MSDLFTDSGARFSECVVHTILQRCPDNCTGRPYRYRLWRQWSPSQTPRTVNFLMLNPSTADETANDPTIERCERRAREWGYNGLIVTNLFAFRATDPKVMLAAKDPAGPFNASAIVQAASDAALVLCAWGGTGNRVIEARARQVLAILRNTTATLHVLRITKGEPHHPLYLPYSLTPQRWRP